MPDAPQQPNILLITTDQQRFDTVRPYKPPFLRTPHLDRLAAQGITFTRAYADTPICVAARVGMLTGQFAHHHGMSGNGATSDFLDRTRTLPALLHSAGYQSYAIGKLHFSPNRARHGFDETIVLDDYYRQMRDSGNPLQPMRHGLGQNELTPGMSTVPEALTLTNWIAEQSRQFIMNRRDPTVPYFLWCSFSKPHPPFDPPEPYYSMYRDCPMPQRILSDWCADDQTPEAMKRVRESYAVPLYSDEVLKAAWAAYYGMITQIDYNIGRVLAAVRESTAGQKGMDNTLILFTSDHGEFLGDHRLCAKTFFHEPSAHVPFIACAPGGFDRGLYGISSSHLVTHADIAATCLRAAGAPVPDHMDGLDLLSLARGEIAPRRHLTSFTGQADSPTASLAITDGRYKYLYFPEGAAEQLFDLDTDPHERHNLARSPQHADQLRDWRAELVRLHSDLSFGYVNDGRLAEFPRRDDKPHGHRRLYGFAPGNTTEFFPKDIQH